MKPQFGAQPNRSHPQSRGVVADYLLNAGTGKQVFDSSQNGSHGTINGATWGPGRNGPALGFDGISAKYILLPDNTIVNFADTNFAIRAWVKPVFSGGGKMVLSKDNFTSNRQFQVGIKGNGKAQAVYWKEGEQMVLQATATSHFTTDVWTDAIWQKRNGAFEILINGLVVPLGAITGSHGPMQHTGASVLIGMIGNSASKFNGQISELMIRSTPFSKEEAMQLHIDSYARYRRPSPSRFFFIPTAAPVVNDPYPPNCTITATNRMIGVITETGVMTGDINEMNQMIGEING